MPDSTSLRLARALLGKTVTVTVDRALGSKHPKHGFLYEVNYGYIAGMKAPDGEDLDAYLLGIMEPAASREGVVIAIIHRLEDDDDKLIVVPRDVTMSDEEIEKAVAFQEQWFKYVIVRA